MCRKKLLTIHFLLFFFRLSTPFGSGTTTSATSALGTSAPSSFGTSNIIVFSPFGNTGVFGTGATPSPSPFGSNPFAIWNIKYSAPSPFGNTGATASVQSSFGGGATTNFGFGLAPTSAQPASTPFGTNDNAN